MATEQYPCEIRGCGLLSADLSSGDRRNRNRSFDEFLQALCNTLVAPSPDNLPQAAFGGPAGALIEAFKLGAVRHFRNLKPDRS